MGKALSQDLLWVIVEKRLFYGDTLEKIAADTLQPLSTVGRVLAWVSSRQSLQTWQGVRAGLPGNAKLDPIHRDRLLEVVLTVDADYSLEEIANLFSSAYGLQLSVPDMSRAMLEWGTCQAPAAEAREGVARGGVVGCAANQVRIRLHWHRHSDRSGTSEMGYYNHR